MNLTGTQSIMSTAAPLHYKVSLLSRLEDIDFDGSSDESRDFGCDGNDKKKSKHHISLILVLSILIWRCISTYDRQSKSQ